MNKMTMAVLALVFSSQTFAQNVSTSTYKADTSSEGFRVSLLRPMLEVEAKVKVDFLGTEITSTDSEDIKDTLGFGIGYAHLPISALGFIGQLGFFTIDGEEGSSDVNFYRAEGNAAYAFNEIVYVKGGLSLAQFTKGEALKDFGMGVGAQLGVGFQITKNLGLDLTYASMLFSGDLKDEGVKVGEAELQFKGLEIGLTGTF